MTQATPPGWYPDPGQTNDAPATERWWDGKAWTDQIRPAGSATGFGPPAHPPGAGPYPPGAGGHPGYPGYPGHPGYAGYAGYPGHPVAAPKRGLRIGIAVAVAAAVLASIGVGVYALTRNDSGSDGSTTSQGSGGQNGQGGTDGGPGGNSGGQGGPGGSGGSGGQSPAPDGSGQPPQTEEGYATDTTSGISIPVPDGWLGSPLQAGAQVTTEASYECPADATKTCTRGGAYSSPVELLKLKATTAEAAAKEDISQAAEDAYGSEGYGKITSHEELASKAVTVAGEKGYYVRWKVVTGKGDDGYVESLAFPSPADSSRLVVVRFGIDVSDEAPKQSVIDDITKGIKKASISGGGSGQGV
ncbi:DUF2510 domain-containing protein [Streptomyces europaeiscabiei]|uniref:DUF2510 domain-containing protein n=1 Tax=Streptomyces europaeiscabiei TaxID=146819 RepID=A0ABU4N5X0_9ACTN|nr:DUF2510 domain-containing protein [Streptomyces europaeiscabiei]MDX3542217.1 DUF2510 domain-containing protein [Streptomyces europaeiscabiei]MDX3551265.1 DUF2510 domain-containing protein [Streptomyces europaeiscabiei]MDX3698175.1 DUF2510 domain-containing protein [Streptomyces europaeiscabiei]MDX3707378.1 DUF2510 domain-containing protein [Streptomyces europaeiscabiei]MDX3842529.1 DUF2510 domain-containing protein [Streptomyces europaeiscabiei]